MAPGKFTPTALVSSTFNASGQEIVAEVSFLGAMTTLSNVPIGPLTLAGTMEQLVEGRASDTELGTWETELTALTLTGSVFGNTLTVVLDPANPSTGSTSVDPAPSGQEGFLRIDSFFDVFVVLMLDSPTPLQTTRGPIRAHLVPAPAVARPARSRSRRSRPGVRDATRWRSRRNLKAAAI